MGRELSRSCAIDGGGGGGDAGVEVVTAIVVCEKLVFLGFGDFHGNGEFLGKMSRENDECE